MELNGIIFKLCKESITSIVVENLANLFQQLWEKAIKVTHRDQEILTCLCFFIDLISYSDYNVNYLTNMLRQ